MEGTLKTNRCPSCVYLFARQQENKEIKKLKTLPATATHQHVNEDVIFNRGEVGLGEVLDRNGSGLDRSVVGPTASRHLLRPVNFLWLLHVPSQPSSQAGTNVTKAAKHKGAKPAVTYLKMASTLKDTRGILQSHGSTGYSLYLPGLISKVTSGAAPGKLLSWWKLQSWHPQVVSRSHFVCSELASPPANSSAAAAPPAAPPAPAAAPGDLAEHGWTPAPHPAADGLGLIRTQTFQSHLFLISFCNRKTPVRPFARREKAKRYKTFLLSAGFLAYLELTPQTDEGEGELPEDFGTVLHRARGRPGGFLSGKPGALHTEYPSGSAAPPAFKSWRGKRERQRRISLC